MLLVMPQTQQVTQLASAPLKQRTLYTYVFPASDTTVLYTTIPRTNSPDTYIIIMSKLNLACIHGTIVTIDVTINHNVQV